MGLLKKITRPISKVLDKIVPNEIKPALPFLAAAAPFMAPGIMGTGMLQRALISGGLNLGAQLAQEGSEGDFNALSVALASGIGALTAPGGGADPLNPVNEFGTKGVVSQPSAADFFSGKAAGMEPGLAKSGLGALEKSATFLTDAATTLQNEPFSKAGLKAALIPVTQGTTDLAIAENRRFNKQQIVDNALAGLGEGFSNADASEAIRLAMLQYGFDDDEITETIAAAGYADGGRVRLQDGGGPDFGGIPAAMQNIKKDEEEMITIMTEQGPVQIKKSIYESMPAMFMDTTTSAYGDAAAGRPVPEFKKGGLMDLGGKEMDLRKGGFVPIGKKEKADDVPARLSKNEFVMTADAVRAAGGGSVNKGAKRMYDLMNKLEARV
jgi:hypothetical protein